MILHVMLRFAEVLIPNHAFSSVRSTGNKSVIIGGGEHSGDPSGVGDAEGRDELEELYFAAMTT